LSSLEVPKLIQPVSGDFGNPFSQGLILLDARKRSVRKHEVAVEQYGRFLKPFNGSGDLANRAIGSEEVLEKRCLHTIFVDEKQEFIQVGTVHGPGIVSKYYTEALAIDLIAAFDLRTRQELHLMQKIVRFHCLCSPSITLAKVGFNRLKHILVELSRPTE
jgi:hypothetical protein